MTEQLREMTARIAGIRQLGAVVNAMRGIAGNRAQRARAALVAVDSYAATLGQAIGRTLGILDYGAAPGPGGAGECALVVFGAEQGFAGGYTERVLEAVGETAGSILIVVGTRGAAVAREHGLDPDWTVAMPAHVEGVPRLADRIAGALFARVADGHVGRIEAAFTRIDNRRAVIERQPLLPLDPKLFPRRTGASEPLLNLSPADLLGQLAEDYVHAQLCHAALHAFAAENEARMQAMAAAHREIDRRLDALAEQARIVRQEEITAEIVELAAGAAASA